MSELSIEDKCVAKNDITIDGKTAFYRGNYIEVKDIEEDTERPDYKYVVHSDLLNRDLHLSNNEIIKCEDSEWYEEKGSARRQKESQGHLDSVKCDSCAKEYNGSYRYCPYCGSRHLAKINKPRQQKSQQRNARFAPKVIIPLVVLVVGCAVVIPLVINWTSWDKKGQEAQERLQEFDAEYATTCREVLLLIDQLETAQATGNESAIESINSKIAEKWPMYIKDYDEVTYYPIYMSPEELQELKKELQIAVRTYSEE